MKPALALALLAGALVSLPGAGAVTAEPYVIGGVDAAMAEYPFMVRLFTVEAGALDGSVCGGTLIRADWVLTAAHCLDSGPYDAVYAFVGTNDDFIPFLPTLSGYGGALVLGDEDAGIFLHPGWTPTSADGFTNDVALLRLRESAVAAAVEQGTDFVPQAAVLNGATSPLLNGGSYTPVTGHAVMAAGWGRTSTASDDQAATLQEGTMTLRSCSPFWSEPTILCAGTTVPGSEDTTCGGDSGGPLLRDVDPLATVSWVQVGITSFGAVGCSDASNPPSAYTNLLQVISFVEGIIDPPPPAPAALKVRLSMAAPYATTGFRIATPGGDGVAECRFVPGDLLDCSGDATATSADQASTAAGAVVVTAFGQAADGTEVARSAPRAATLSAARLTLLTLALKPLAGDGSPGSGYALLNIAPRAPYIPRLELVVGDDTCTREAGASWDCTGSSGLVALEGPYVAVPAPATVAWTLRGQAPDPASPGDWVPVTLDATRSTMVRGAGTASVMPTFVPLGSVVKLDPSSAPYAVSAVFTLQAGAETLTCLVDPVQGLPPACDPSGAWPTGVVPLEHPYVLLQGALPEALAVTAVAHGDDAGTDPLGPASRVVNARPMDGRATLVRPMLTLAPDLAVFKVTARPGATGVGYAVRLAGDPGDLGSCDVDLASGAVSACSGLRALANGHVGLQGPFAVGQRLDHFAGDLDSARAGALLARPVVGGRVTAVAFRLL